jgi:hypothetical protein
MVEEALVERKVEASIKFANDLIARGLPLLAAYWEFQEERGRWVFVLVPRTPEDERRLLDGVVALLIGPAYRGVFGVSDPLISSRQIDRARALGAYIRVEPYIGRRIDTTFTGGHYFESVVPVYLAPQLMTHLVA